MKPVSELLHRTPWWAVILAGLAMFAMLAFFVTPYHIIQWGDEGRTAAESRAIKREVDNTLAENAINLGRSVVRGMISRTTDPERRAELEQALAGLEEARTELREVDREAVRAKREAVEAAHNETVALAEALAGLKAQMEADPPASKQEARAALKAAEQALRAAKRAEREAERALKRAERGPSFRVGPKVGDEPMVQIEIEPPAPPEPPLPADPAIPAVPADPATAGPPALPPLPPELASKIRRDVTGDMYRIGIGAAMILLLVPLFLVAVVIKFFVDRSRASQRMAESKRKEADYHRMSQQVTEAKLSALQAQVEPHFLYNTLASVQALTEVDPARANEMTGHLIQYLRNALPKMRESVSTVGQEVELVRAYLSILKMRMGERLAFTIDVPAQCADMPFPPLMLPSLVENAIKHGLEPQREGGTVHITASTDGGRLRLIVADTGRGFSETPGAGVGLANIRERLAALYGGNARLTIEANAPTGVVATIDVPAEGTRSRAAAGPGASTSPAFTPPPPPPAPSPVQPEADAIPSGFWARTWEVLIKVERGWRVALYYLYLILVGLAGVTAVVMFLGAAVGAVPVDFGDGLITGPASIAAALAAAVLGFVVATIALAVVTLVIYCVGFLLFAVALFVVAVFAISISPVLAPFILLGLAIWYIARKRKAKAAPQSAGERIEPTLAE